MAPSILSVATSGNAAVRSVAAGLGGDPGNQGPGGFQGDRGAVYSFVRDAQDLWSPRAYVKASNTTTRFGWTVSLSDDGQTLTTGAYNEDSGRRRPGQRAGLQRGRGLRLLNAGCAGPRGDHGEGRKVHRTTSIARVPRSLQGGSPIRVEAPDALRGAGHRDHGTTAKDRA